MLFEYKYTLDEIDRAAAAFIKAIGNYRHIAFYGEMGAGKTTFVAALCRALGCGDEVASPTFAIVNEYQGVMPIYHFDFYRINKPDEALDFGLYEYFDSGEMCFMEWPECIESLLPDDTLKVQIAIAESGERVITIDE